jgi:methionine aminopeptidase
MYECVICSCTYIRIYVHIITNISIHIHTQKNYKLINLVGIGELFHTSPNVPHYPGNKAKGKMAVGHIFTIEPMINIGICVYRV